MRVNEAHQIVLCIVTLGPQLPQVQQLRTLSTAELSCCAGIIHWPLLLLLLLQVQLIFLLLTSS
jgi:hypothetical protein